MRKKIGAFGAGQFSPGTLVDGRPGTTIFQNPGGGGGAGGCRIQGPGPAAPPGAQTEGFPTWYMPQNDYISGISNITKEARQPCRQWLCIHLCASLGYGQACT